MNSSSKIKAALKPIADGLLGKQSPYRVPQKQYAVRPVGRIVADLCRIPDREWGRYAFSREPLNRRFTDAQRMELTDRAIACGREYATRCMREYGVRDSEVMATRMGMQVDFPHMPQNTDRVLFAEFKTPNHIHVYMDAVEKAEVLRGEPGVSHTLTNYLYIPKLLIAHELFHCVEDRYAREIWTQTYRVELWAPKFLHNRSRVGVLGEIAAMAFAKELNQLPYSPYVMDAFLVYGYSPMAASGLYEEMMTLAGRTPDEPDGTEGAAGNHPGGRAADSNSLPDHPAGDGKEDSL